MRSAPDKSFSPAHLTEPQIIAYLDGELSRPEQLAARAHLESCWNCRYLMNMLEESVANFLGARASVFPEEPETATSRVAQFRHRLDQHAARSVPPAPSLPERLAGFIRALRAGNSALARHRQPVIASVVAVCILIAMFTDVLNTRVSADTVLQHAQSYDNAHLPAAGQVTLTSVRVDRVDHRTRATQPLGTITVVRDSATPEVYVSARSASGQSRQEVLPDSSAPIEPEVMNVVLSTRDAALEEYLARQRWVPDLSVAQFRRLVDGRQDGEVSARKQGQQFELLYPFAPQHASGITEAWLLLDAKEYAPTSLHISTKDQAEYEFTRTDFSSEQRTAEVAMLFAPLEISRRSRLGAPELPSVSRPTPLSYAESRATEAEVNVTEALHQVDACLGEEINVFVMSDRSLLVQGLVDSGARRNAIERSLKGLEGVRVQVYVPRELKSGAELYNPPDHFAEPLLPAGSAASSATLADVSSSRTPLYDKLYEHFSKGGGANEETAKQVAVFSNELVTAARQTFLHAWALKRLDREFSPHRAAELSPAAMSKVDAVRQDHRRWIATLAHQQAQMLSSVSDSSVAADLLDSSGAPLDSDSLLQLAQQQNDLIRSLLSVTRPAGETDAGLARLLALLRRMGT